MRTKSKEQRAKKGMLGEQPQKTYNPSQIEPKWQKFWKEKGVFYPDLGNASRPYFNLMMFPYPSAEGMHVGNMYAFTGADIWGRYQRMWGNDVFEPIGLDGFGIHSENYAIKIGGHPKNVSEMTEKRFYAQLKATGNAYDWRHAVETYDPVYYRWTQWIFVQMFKHGLAYRKKAQVNWCSSCKTVLADEQVIGGECERCSTAVEKRELEQWFFKITDYAERLLQNLDKIDWAPRVKVAQRNWIGKSRGAEIKFSIFNFQFSISAFTTRPDTLYGVTFLVISPDSPLVEKLVTRERKDEVEEYIEKYQRSKIKDQKEGSEEKKMGVFTGSYAVNPASGENIPVWIANYVVSGYGSEAVMGVPAHDQRDFEFAKIYDLPIVQTIQPEEDFDKSRAYAGPGKIVNSGDWNGIQVPGGVDAVIQSLIQKGWGREKVAYHLRDWLISRQRYWGPPIPMIFCEKCKWQPVPEDQLPVQLPYVEDYRPTGSGVSPLAQDQAFLQTTCPGCGGPAKRETDVSDTFLDSAWYYLGYLILGNQKSKIKNQKFEWDKHVVKRWLPVTMYIGGAEHSVLHLMYSRFVTMALYDWGMLDFEEPFSKFYAHGLIIKDGAKMSKSKGNVVVPDEYIKKFGADSVRTYLMFLGPFDQGGDFRDAGMEGMFRFVRRVWGLVANSSNLVLTSGDDSRVLLQKIHQTVKRVTDDLNGLRYNRAVAGLMEYVNVLEEFREKSTSKEGRIRCAEWEEALKALLLLFAPFAPHMTEELWQALGTRLLGTTSSSPSSLVPSASIHLQPWPKYDPELLKEEVIQIPVQVNGRLRGTVQVPSADARSQSRVEEQAAEQPSVKKYLENGVKKVVFVPGKLINFVTSQP